MQQRVFALDGIGGGYPRTVMRRKGIIITYKNLDDETITEKLTYDFCIADDFFRLDSSWTRITDALPVGGNITIGSNGNWFQDGVDTGFKAQGPKGDNGLTPMLRTVNNKLRYSYDGEVWYEISEYIAAWFRYQDNKIHGIRKHGQTCQSRSRKTCI